MKPPLTNTQTYRIEEGLLKRIYNKLKEDGFKVVGPVVKDKAIGIDEIQEFGQIPRGYYDKQEPGQYQFIDKGDSSFFKYSAGVESFKRFLHPSMRRLWKASAKGDGFQIERDNKNPKLAFLGMRSCDLHAIQIHNEVFINGQFKNTYFERLYGNLFVIAVSCTEASSNCFCTSMDTGPRPTSGYDLLLTEIKKGGDQFFILETGSDRGKTFVEKFELPETTKEDHDIMEDEFNKVVSQIFKKLDKEGSAKLLRKNYEHPHWDEVAERCLSCANCTMVCPTCFCTTTEDINDLTGDHTERWLRWDSCFNMDFSYIHGGVIRNSTKSRYRQWLTHKLSTWYDQFGMSGCVGCGRCITWCPVGIDLTKEIPSFKQKST